MKRIYILIFFLAQLVHFASAETPGNSVKVDPSITPSCSPLALVDVTVTNKPIISVCDDCDTWYLSLWEWDGSTGYNQLGSAIPFDNGPVYSWTGVNWDFATYPCLVLIWHYVDTGGAACNCPIPDKVITNCPPSAGNWPVPNFYPSN
ncbi:MAG: hypothetical protein M0P47_06075 [Bacteroidales bacterium]|nr:hypothetical protein [Bacteroidales bacterium]